MNGYRCYRLWRYSVGVIPYLALKLRPKVSLLMKPLAAEIWAMLSSGRSAIRWKAYSNRSSQTYEATEVWVLPLEKAAPIRSFDSPKVSISF